MAELLGVSIYVWLPLVLPPLLLALILAVWRTRVWGLLIALSWSAAGAALAECLYDILVAKRFDQKFQYAPAVALALSLLGAAGIVSIGLLLFGLLLAGEERTPRKTSDVVGRCAWRAIHDGALAAVALIAIAVHPALMAPANVGAVEVGIPYITKWVCTRTRFCPLTSLCVGTSSLVEYSSDA